MRARWTQLVERLRSRVSLRVVATTLVTALSLALIAGFAVLTTTSLGCGPAAKLGLKGISSHCRTTANVIALASPTPSASIFPTFSPPAQESPSPIAPASPPVSGPVPTSGPGSPYTGPVSSAFPPFTFPASSGGVSSGKYPLTCRLPVYAGPPGSGGFVQFPGANFVADPSSSVALPSSGASPAPQGPGYGQQYGGMAYDRAFSRWLPVPPSWVSPDGSRYAFAATDGIYWVDVATGAEHQLGGGHAWTIVGVKNQGVYASLLNQGGLWLLPYTSAAQQITATGFWQAVGSSAAYGTATSAVPQGVANTIIRADLQTGALTNWFTRQGANSSVRGVDSQGYPVIDVYIYSTNVSETWIAKGATADPIFGSDEFLYDQGTPVADTHGLWFAFSYNAPGQPYTQGVALYVPGTGFYWMSSYGVQLAGGCS